VSSDFSGCFFEGANLDKNNNIFESIIICEIIRGNYAALTLMIFKYSESHFFCSIFFAFYLRLLNLQIVRNAIPIIMRYSFNGLSGMISVNATVKALKLISKIEIAKVQPIRLRILILEVFFFLNG